MLLAYTESTVFTERAASGDEQRRFDPILKKAVTYEEMVQSYRSRAVGQRYWQSLEEDPQDSDSSRETTTAAQDSDSSRNSSPTLSEPRLKKRRVETNPALDQGPAALAQVDAALGLEPGSA